MLSTYKYLIAAIIGVVYSASLLGVGWKAHEWYTGYQENKMNEVKAQIKQANQEVISSIAKSFEDQKVLLDESSKDYGEKLRNITSTKTIYKNVCLDEDAVQVLKDYKLKSSTDRGFQNDKK